MRTKSLRRFKSIYTIILVAFTLLTVLACNKPKVVVKNGFNLINNGIAATIYVEGENVIGSTSGDYPGVVRAAYDLQEDIKKVTQFEPVIVNSKEDLNNSEFIVIAGSIEKNNVIKELINNNKIDVSEIKDKWEAFTLQVVQDPFSDGKIKSALVIAGSDKRGTIYGIYEVSNMLGVSPWGFWADQEPLHKDNLTLEADYKLVQGEPTVQYRGIFFNDEEKLSNWSTKLDDGKFMGPNAYKEIFELLLRLRANYIWPAMHTVSDAFNDFPENRIYADYYGIVVGTSHVDMLMRNNINEWDTFVAKYKKEHNYTGNIVYDYTVNPEIVREYWRESVRMYKDYEVQYSLGMRGAHDEPFTTANIYKAPWNGDRVKLLEQIIEDQRQILREELNNPTLEGVFMIFTPYKEVQEIYNSGMNLPEDVTIMQVDDNHGFVRQLPNVEERERVGGNGVYYHNSYWGPDNESYMWLNAMPLTLMYEELSKSIQYNAKKNWILNIGDMKPGEFEMSFFLNYAYDADKYTQENVYDFAETWAENEFGKAYAKEIREILKNYGQYTNVRKLEHQQVDLFTNIVYTDEYEKRMAMYQDLKDRAEAIYNQLPDEKKASFYQMVLYQVRVAYFTNAEFYYATKANFAAEQGKSVTAYNSFEMSKYFYEAGLYENSYYNKVLSDGKWDGILNPDTYAPPVASGFAENGAWLSIGQNGGNVIVEGEYLVGNNSKLDFYNYAQGRKFIDVFNTGYEPLTFNAVASQDWIKLSVTSGTAYDETRIWVEVDWTKITAKETTGSVVINYGQRLKTVTITAYKETLTLNEKTYVEQDGYISMEAEHYSRVTNNEDNYWETIKDLGRVSGDMIRVNSNLLSGYSELSYLNNAPYVEYDAYFLSTGTFEMEVYRLPTLCANGKIRFAVGVDNNTPVVVSGENDYGVGNYDWEFGIFNQIFKHKVNIDITTPGVHTIKLYMIDPFLTFDKLVVYTDDLQPSYLGPDESYNTTFNTKPYESGKYEQFYETKFLPQVETDITDMWGTGYLYEHSGRLLIEAEYAAENSQYAYTSNPVNKGWMLSRNQTGYMMRTGKYDVNYAGQHEIAPTLNYQVIFNQTGTYNVWLRYEAPFPSGDSFGFGLNGEHKFSRAALFSWNREETFEWRNVGTVSISNQGVQTINIFAEEDGLIIDKIYLTRYNENPGNMSINPSVRTSVYDSMDLSKARTDAALKQAIQSKLLEYVHYNIPVGTKLGTYNIDLRTAYYDKLTEVFNLYNTTRALTEAEVDNSLIELSNAYTALTNSKLLVGENNQKYLLFEDFDSNNTGLSPFGLKTNVRIGEANVGVYSENDSNNYLAIRTFYEQAFIQNADMYYEFTNSVNGEIVVETRTRFNEGRWGNIAYLLDEDKELAVAVAFENANGLTKDIVAYNGTTKVRIGKFELDTWVDIKLEINTITNTFDVYLNGQLAAQDFTFRNPVTNLKYYKLGTNSAYADLNIDYIKAYLKNDFVIRDLEDVDDMITMIPQVGKAITTLPLPLVPDGFRIEIKSSSLPHVVKLNGEIVVPLVDTYVDLVLKVTDTNTNLSADTKTIRVLIPGVSSREAKELLQEVKANVSEILTQLPVGVTPGRFSITEKTDLESLINEANVLLLADELTYGEAMELIGRLETAHDALLASKVMTEVINGVTYEYYAYEDFNAYNQGSMPYDITYLPNGTNSAYIVKEGENGLYKLTTGTGQAYNRLNLSETLSGIVVAEVRVKVNSTAANTFTNLIFLMSENSTTPVASVAFDRPASTTSLKYHDGSGWKTTLQEANTNISYTPGEFATVKMVINIDLGSYDVYYNDVLVYQNVPFRYGAAKDSISYLNFGTQKNNEEIYFDYIKVYSTK